MSVNRSLIEPPMDCGFDKLQMLFGEDYRINQAITIYQCSVQQIVDFGQKYFFQTVAPFVSNPTTYRLQLWKMKIDWTQISDFDLFCMLAPGLAPEVTCILFGRFDFTRLQLMMRKDTEEKVLYDPQTDSIIDEATYIVMRQYIRLLLNQYPRRQKIKGRASKQLAIDEDEQKLRNEAKKRQMGNVQISSYLYDLIITMLITPGFKYKKDELRDINIMQFMAEVSKFQIFKATQALMQGMYSGFLDTSKIDVSKQLNWFRNS